jgi:pimeloyl-ACP methyl ester carboxylesterase
MRHREFIVNGGHRIAASFAGPEGGMPVMLLHGGGQTRHAWGKAAAALARVGCRAYSLDLRGHGDSAWSADGNYALEAYCDDLRGVVEQIGRTPALVGASLGGMVALLAAAETPPLAISCLVLVDVTARLSTKGVDYIAGFMNGTVGGFDSIEEAGLAVAKYLPHRKPPKDLSGLRKNLREGKDGRLYWHWDPAMQRGGSEDDMATLARRMEAAARLVDAPTLILRGGKSELVTPEAASEFVQMFPRGEFVEIGDAHHMVAGDQNDPFSQAMVDFIGRHTAPL